MGVHGLWELLAPVGRRVSVETLAGKKLAIDASIWMIQFMKAMRDEKGEMVRNAHVLGFFRRICKLLFLRAKPVFVFDGGTPALKRRTVVARRRQRENAQAKIRKTAEKLLLNHLKAMKLKELAKDLEDQRQKNGAKGKRKIKDETEMAGNTSLGNETNSSNYNQEALDEMLAASLAAEDDESLMRQTSTSTAGFTAEEEDADDEEMILPEMLGKVDPAVLAALPPSMQLDLLVQMRERLMAENRQKYQKVKKAPERFSELQIQAYLKTVAFRREINEVQKTAAGRGVGGVQTSRIASEANREYIFSSSFTGDKQVLASAGVERNSSGQLQRPAVPPSSECPNGVASAKKSSSSGLTVDESRRVIDSDVETYLDERGRVRVSRVRAMGLRMTRDLQRNLDLMKEVEQERVGISKIENRTPITDESTVVPRKCPSKIQVLETSDLSNDGTGCLNGENEEFINRTGTSIEVSFDDDGKENNVESDDDLFTQLVAGDSDIFAPPAVNIPSMKGSSDSDCEWEEGGTEVKYNTLNHEVKVGNKSSLLENSDSHESEVNWEEGASDIPGNASLCPTEERETILKGDIHESDVEWEQGVSNRPGNGSSSPPKYSDTVSKGALEEEVNFQEAIRRSIEDLKCQKYTDASSEDKKLNKCRKMATNSTHFGPVYQEKKWNEPIVPAENVQPDGSSSEGLAGVERPDSVGGADNLKIDDYQSIHPEHLQQDSSASEKSCGVVGHVGSSVSPPEEREVNYIAEQIMHTSSVDDQVSTGTRCGPANSSHSSASLLVNTLDTSPADDRPFLKDHLQETVKPNGSLAKESTTDNYDVQKLAEEENKDFIKEKEDFKDNSAPTDGNNKQVEITEANLEEELQNLDKECTALGDEQRKFESNAQAVSSEMFAECQELLQMFGLPYIIAPMEAEAQCAQMELANLVDGVVTDDSDVFLFGARSVYKNIFDDRKYVETYFMKDIENELGLTREKLIRMALLLGSDYTEGVSGIGIVNAIEVINAFPEEEGLLMFREWIESPDPAIFGKVDLQTGSSLRKRGSKVAECYKSSSTGNLEGASESDQRVPMDDLHQMKQNFMDKHRNVSKNWHIPSSFPSEAVISAYDSPQVDKSTDPFSWGKPDVFVLRKLCWEKFGWGTQKADELLVPVLKEYNKHETQLRMEAFYTFNERFAKIRSKRIKKAVKGVVGNKSLELMDDTLQDNSKSRKKRKVSFSEAGNEKSGDSVRSGGSVDGDEMNSAEEPAANQMRKRRIHGETFPSEVGNAEPLIQTVSKQNSNKESSVRARGRGRGRRRERGRGKRRGQAAGRGRRNENSGMEYTETSSDGNNSESEQELPVENYEGSHEFRRSTRLRRAVKYNVDDLEIDELGITNHDSGFVDDEAGGKLCRNARMDDAAANPSKRNHQEVGDPSLEGLFNDHLEMVGGISMDEAVQDIGTGQLGLDENGDPHFETGLSQEYYLRMGGGFCLEEAEVDENPNKCGTSPSENQIPDCPGFVDEAEHYVISNGECELVSDPVKAVYELRPTVAAYVEQNLGSNDSKIHENPLNTEQSQGNIDEDASGTKPVRSLRAMPSLRRKRRR